MDTSDVVIVTRHKGLVEVLREDFGIEGSVIEHATPSEIAGKIVIGVLPLHMAALTHKIGSVDLDLPPNLRGVEMTADLIRAHMRSSVITWYVVRLDKEYRNLLDFSARLLADHSSAY